VSDSEFEVPRAALREILLLQLLVLVILLVLHPLNLLRRTVFALRRE